jgi:hypothetical protein
MCSGNDQLRTIDPGESAAREGDLDRYRQLGGADGINYRERLKKLGPKFDPLAKTGIFLTQDLKATGPADLRSASAPYPGASEAANPFYSTVIARRPQPSTPAQANGGYNPFQPKVLPTTKVTVK